jgi:hypothetical protein
MWQIKHCITINGANKWLKENKDKKLISVNGHTGGWTIVYEEL